MFLHGFGADHTCFCRQIDYFSRFYRVTCFDFIGFGKSAALTEAFSVDDYAEWTKTLFYSLGIQCPHIVAHSFGARVAIALLSSYRAKSLVITGGAGIVPRRTLLYRIRVGTYRFVRAFAPAFAEGHFGSPDYQSLSPIARESFKKTVNTDLRERARQIDCPVLLVYGKDDCQTPPSYGRIFSESFPNARLTVWDGCDHFLFLTHPTRFNLAVHSFLSEQNPTPYP